MAIPSRSWLQSPNGANYAEEYPLLTGNVGTGWSGTSAPYTIAVTVTGVLASGADYIVDLAMNATTAQRAAWNAGSIKATAQGANSITLTADGTKPTITLPIQVKRF